MFLHIRLGWFGVRLIFISRFRQLQVFICSHSLRALIRALPYKIWRGEWEPALTLARKNLAQSGVAERVELRSQRMEHLDDVEIFTLVCLPGPFIAAEIVAVALERIRRALAPGGWLIFGLYARPPNELGEALTNLRIVRGGGHPWTTREVEERLGALGFERIEAVSPSLSIILVLGQRPDVPD